MVWGAITWGQKSSLEIIDGSMTSVKYHDLLDEVRIPFGINSLGPGFIFQDDNARPHLGTIVMEYHENRHGIP